jgi:hypothetical protein
MVAVRALRKTGKAEALAQLVEQPDLVANISAAARLWGVSRSTARAWMEDHAAMAVPPEPPPADMAVPPPVPPSPVAPAMADPTPDVAPTAADERPPGEAAPADMAATGATPSTAMAATEAAPIAEKPAGIPARLIERPTWRIMSWRIMPPVERPARRDWLTTMIALAIATVSAAFSIYGLTGIFVRAFWPVIAMGTVLEAGKLRAIALIGMGRGSWRVRSGLVAMVVVLMCLNAIGAYGFLAKAHIGHQVESDVVVTARLADVDGRIAVQAAALADIDRRLGQIDGAIEKAMAQGKVNGAMALAGDQRRNRTDLQVERMAAGKVLVELKVERARIDGERRTVEVDLGSVRYLAALLGAGDQDVLRYFILVVAMLMDPLALLLLLGATAPPRIRSHD